MLTEIIQSKYNINKYAATHSVNILQTSFVETVIHVKCYFNNKAMEINTRRLPATLRTEVKEDFKETRYRQSKHSLIKFSENSP